MGKRVGEMIVSIKIQPDKGKTEFLQKPTREDLMHVISAGLQKWTGCLEIQSDDDWSLTMFAECGKYQIGIAKFDSVCFFAKNPDILKSDGTRIGVAWSDAPNDEVITQEDSVKKCLLDFFEIARPTSGLQWRQVRVG